MLAERRVPAIAAAVVLLLMAACCAAPARALRLTVHNEECLFQEVEKEGELMFGHFVVFDHHDMWDDGIGTLNFVITGPKGETIESVQHKSEHQFHFRAILSGTYKFCLTNEYGAPESVDFQVQVAGMAPQGILLPGSAPDVANKAKSEDVDRALIHINNIHEQVGQLLVDQHYFRAREARRRQTNESTSRRVLYYAVLEALVLMAASGGQVLVLRHLFEKKTRFR